MLPAYLHRFFWEHKPEDLSDVKHSFYIAERLLEHGDDEAINWLLRRYGRKHIIEVVLKSRRISRKTANFWSNIYSLRKDEVYCLNQLSQSQG